jgi:hypothetical protein
MNAYFVATTIAGKGIVDMDPSRRSLNGVDRHQTPLALELELDSESSTATASTANATSENIFPSSDVNPGTITLNPLGGMIISGSVKLTADIKVEGQLTLNPNPPFNAAGITLLSGAVLDCNGHSITGEIDPVNPEYPEYGNDGIFVAKVMEQRS